MAAELAQVWGVSPIVSRVSIDGRKAAMVKAENSNITALQRGGDGGLRWTQLDNSLPLPLPLENEMMQFVLSISDLASIDQQILQVTNLPASHYELQIDGKPAGGFTRKELADGINLALYPTPMQSQAKEVDGDVLERSQLDQAIFLLTINDPKNAADPSVIKGIEAKQASLLEEERKECLPHPHTFELLPK
jgi:hypothetical protein